MQVPAHSVRTGFEMVLNRNCRDSWQKKEKIWYLLCLTHARSEWENAIWKNRTKYVHMYAHIAALNTLWRLQMVWRAAAVTDATKIWISIDCFRDIDSYIIHFLKDEETVFNSMRVKIPDKKYDFINVTKSFVREATFRTGSVVYIYTLLNYTAINHCRQQKLEPIRHVGCSRQSFSNRSKKTAFWCNVWSLN